MRVTVLGAGVVGVTTAYYLARAGHEVTVLDRQPGPALETSFANAGEISPGYASPWAAPGVPMKALKWLTMAHAPLILRPKPDLAMAAWILATLRNCTASRYATNKSRMVRLAQYSRDRLVELRAETGLTYDHRSLGTLQLFRTQAQMDGVAKDVSVLQADGVAYEVLDTAGCVAAEPGLAHAKDHIVGGLRLPGDETGDCFKFTQGLAALAAALGVDFRYGVTIQGLQVDGARVTGVRTDQGLVTSEAYVVALGSHSPALLRPFGVGLPIYPVKGYSITVPIKAVDRAPVSTLLDESFKIAVTRLGDRIRVGGMAELSGYSTDLPLARRRTLEHCLESLFPGAGATEEASFWSGLRPMTPDSVPLIGPCALGNLFLNSGHGTLGWTMACGSAQVLADQISGVRPAIETQDLSLARSPA